MMTLPSFFLPPGRTAATISTPSVASMTSSVYGAFIFRVNHTGTIKTVTCGSSSVVTTPGNVEVSLQDVNLTTGLPDDGKDQYRVVNFTGASALFKTGTLTSTGADGGNQRSVTRGDWLAVVFIPESGVAAQLAGSRNAPANGSSYVASNTAATWSKGSTTVGVALAIEYNDGYFESLELDPAQIASVSYATGSTPDERALYFVADAAYRVSGARVMVDGDNDFDVILYDSSSNVLASVSVDKDTRGDTAGEPFVVYFPSVTLTSGATYRLAVKPTTASNIALIYYVFRANGEIAQVMGMSAQMSTRTDAGAWSQTNTQLPAIALLIDGIEVGGLLRHPGMAGGMNG